MIRKKRQGKAKIKDSGTFENIRLFLLAAHLIASNHANVYLLKLTINAAILFTSKVYFCYQIPLSLNSAFTISIPFDILIFSITHYIVYDFGGKKDFQKFSE